MRREDRALWVSRCGLTGVERGRCVILRKTTERGMIVVNDELRRAEGRSVYNRHG